VARKDEGKLRLKSGHFYVDRGGYVWCCYQIDTQAPPEGQAECIRVDGSRKEYFYIDGRYDLKGEREHTLVRELDFKDAWIDETYEVHDRIIG
jgi:hypothetical protein